MSLFMFRRLVSLPRRLRTSARAMRPVLGVARVRAVVISSVLARLPKGMVPLATIMVVGETTGSYLIAGSVVGVVAVSDAVTTPLKGRLVDRLGLRQVCLPAAAVQIAGIVWLLADEGADGPVGRLAAAFLIGFGSPPISAGMKAIWPRLVTERTLPAAYTVESLAQQIVFLAGPLMVTLAAVVGAPFLALAVSAGLLAAGTSWFVHVAPASVPRRSQHGRRRPGALRCPSVSTLIGATVLQGVAFGALPVGLTAFASASRIPSLVGALQAALTVGGLLGTFAPVRVINKQRYVRTLAGFAVGLTPVAALSATPSLPTAALMAMFLVIAGLFLTPIAAASYVLLQLATCSSNRTEAFAWLSTGQAAGSAAGAVLAGVLADHGDALSALAALPAVVALAALWSHRRLP